MSSVEWQFSNEIRNDYETPRLLINTVSGDKLRVGDEVKIIKKPTWRSDTVEEAEVGKVYRITEIYSDPAIRIRTSSSAGTLVDMGCIEPFPPGPTEEELAAVYRSLGVVP